jgi:hypothetical protein
MAPAPGRRRRGARNAASVVACGLAAWYLVKNGTGIMWSAAGVREGASSAPNAIAINATVPNDTFSDATIPSEVAIVVTQQDPGQHRELLEGRTPFFVASIIFGLQAIQALATIYTIRILRRRCQNIKIQLGHVEESCWVYSIISLAGALAYFHYSFGSEMSLLQNLAPDPGDYPHLGKRHLIWLISTPLQWISFARSSSEATVGEIRSIVLWCIAMQLFGMLMLWASTLTAWVIMFSMSLISFVCMFREAYRLPLVKEHEWVSRKVLHMYLVLWSMYPLLTCARVTGLLSIWYEQVLGYTVLDVTCKTVTHSGIVLVYVLNFSQWIDQVFTALGGSGSTTGEMETVRDDEEE